MKKTTFHICLLVLLSLSAIPVQAAEAIRYHGSSTVVQVVAKASLPFQQQSGIVLDIKSEGSSVGIEKLLAGECDIAGVGQPLTDDLKSKGVVATKLFSDAYAVIANQHVPVDALQLEQLQGILTGKNVSWADFAPGKEYTIKLVTPPASSAHFTNFQQRFGIEALPLGTTVTDKAPYVAEEVMRHPRAIGWLSYSTVHLHRENIKILGITAGNEVIQLDEKSVSSREYPFISDQYIYTMGEPSGNVKKFIDFLNSQNGKAIIIDSGFFVPGS
ncbi:MAG: substrate-binding domain-containing protein [Desulfobulbaceae bacterium]|nr:substrate-binding domain-containing protein [Desulfobulbaceae bacterium]